MDDTKSNPQDDIAAVTDSVPASSGAQNTPSDAEETNIPEPKVNDETIDDSKVEDGTLKMEDRNSNEENLSSNINPQDSTINSPSSTIDESTEEKSQKSDLEETTALGADDQPEEKAGEAEASQAEELAAAPQEETVVETTEESAPQAAETKEASSGESELDDEKVAEEVLTEEDKRRRELSKQGKWYVIHTFAGHENRVAATLNQRIEAEHLENNIFDILVPTQDKIEIKGGKKETVKEKIFPGYILVKMIFDDETWLAVRTTPGVTSFIGAGNKPTPISEAEVATIVKFSSQGA